MDRYRAICRPFKSKHTNALVGTAWAAALTCCLPQVLIFQATQPRVCYKGIVAHIERCSAVFPSWLSYPHYTIYFSLAFFFLPITVLTITNSLICQRIWTSGGPSLNCSVHTAVDNSGNSSRSNSNNTRTKLSVHNFRSSSVIISRAKIKTVKLTLVIIALYIVCSAPFVVGQLLSSLKIIEMMDMEPLYWLMTLNSLANPWVYLAFNWNLLCLGRLRRGSNSDTQMPPVLFAAARAAGTVKGAKNEVNSGLSDE